MMNAECARNRSLPPHWIYN